MKKSGVVLIKIESTLTGYKILKRVGTGSWRKYRHLTVKQRKKNCTPAKGFLLVTAGIEGYWAATQDEINAFCDLFVAALDHPGSVVAVRNGVTAEWMEIK